MSQQTGRNYGKPRRPTRGARSPASAAGADPGMMTSRQVFRGAAAAAGGVVLDRFLAGKLMNDVRFLKNLVNAEKNFFDTSTALNPATTPTAQCLNLIAQGDDVQQRSGRSIKLAGVDIRYHVSSPVAATTPQLVRFIVLQARDPNGAAPVIADVLQAVTVDSPMQASTHQGQFTIHYDKLCVLPIIAAGGSLIYDVKLDLKNHVEFIGTAAPIANVGNNALFVFAMADQVATNASAGAFYSRVWFYDN
jgi:hypothetical protein